MNPTRHQKKRVVNIFISQPFSYLMLAVALECENDSLCLANVWLYGCIGEKSGRACTKLLIGVTHQDGWIDDGRRSSFTLYEKQCSFCHDDDNNNEEEGGSEKKWR